MQLYQQPQHPMSSLAVALALVCITAHRPPPPVLFLQAVYSEHQSQLGSGVPGVTPPAQSLADPRSPP